MMHSLHLNFPAIVPKSNFDTKKPGLTMLSDPIVFLDDFRQCCRTPLSFCSARRRHWGRGHPLQAHFDIKTLCLRYHRLKAVIAFAAQRTGFLV